MLRKCPPKSTPRRPKPPITRPPLVSDADRMVRGLPLESGEAQPAMRRRQTLH